MKRIVLYLIFSVIMRLILKIFTGTKLINKENLQYKGPCIIVGNHNSHLDTISILANLPLDQLVKTHPIAAGDYFGKSPFKAWLTRFFVNAVLIPRSRPKEGETGPDPIQMMVDVLEKGESLILFPEGSRGEPEIFQKFKRGVGLVLEKCPDVPYIPVYMKGLGKILPKGDSIPVPFDSYMHVGKPVFPIEETADEIVVEVEKHIRSLMEKEVQE
ncbi:MAG: 1-acyl-sn-glycerol-3-phosphate acyltransferase [Fluviicola sp.]|nr:1-acyl-sn-glycerol-3-phosphate acyltransferase [Fluviicola sp.]